MAAATRYTLSGRRWVALTSVLLLAALPGAARAATVVLLNGEEVQGELLDVEPSELTLRVGRGLVHIELRQVRDVLLAGGESVWERRLRTALRESREAGRRRRAGQLARALEAAAAETPGPAASDRPDETATRGAARRIDLPPQPGEQLSFSGHFRDEQSGIALRFPLGWEAKREDEGFWTFRDPRPDAVGIWRFDLTLFDRVEEPYDVVAPAARRQLEQLAHYRIARRETVQLGLFLGEHIVGLYDHDGVVVRHDQVVIESRRHVVVFMFFTPGHAETDDEVPEVAAVLRSVEFGRH
ncbi:MAG: hypothetical protein D6776_04115 [Planctomycetota bacterium]|nr:MAG: hypothetical protein D6776_04115 [Planctomycetota bacterium]